MFKRSKITNILLSPNHIVHNSCVALYEFDYYRTYIRNIVCRHLGTVVGIVDHADGKIDSLDKAMTVDAGEDKNAFVQRFRTFGRSAYADGGKCMSYTGKE